MERLIDSFTDGLIEKYQFTSRMTRTKTRITVLMPKLKRVQGTSINSNIFDLQLPGFAS
jgi:hypothetical protein